MFIEGVSLYGYYLRLTPYFISSPSSLPLENPHPHPPHTGVKVELQPKTMCPHPTLGSGNSNVQEFFKFDNFFPRIFACMEMEFFWATGGGKEDFFAHMFFLGTRPRGESIF
jgi:hypothetical protein